jgi:hypothetical protein
VNGAPILALQVMTGTNPVADQIFKEAASDNIIGLDDALFILQDLANPE